MNFDRTFKAFKPDAALDMIPFRVEDAIGFMDTMKGIVPRVIAISSIDVYLAYGRFLKTEPGPLQPVPLSEKAELRKTKQPRGDDYDKIGIEQIVMKDSRLPGTILRLPGVYGPKDPLRRVGRYLKYMDDMRPVIVINERENQWRFSRGYVDNVAAAIALAVTNDRSTGQVYNVAEPEAVTEVEWIRRIGEAAGWDGQIVMMPEDSLPEHLREGLDLDQDWVVDTMRIRQELGYHEVIGRDDALMRSIGWERENPPSEYDEGRYGKLDYEAENLALKRFNEKSEKK